MKHLYESILSNDLEGELDDLVELNDINQLFFGDDDWGHIKSFKGGNLVLNVTSEKFKNVSINDYRSKHKIKSIDFGKSKICVLYDGIGQKSIDLKAGTLDFCYKTKCELENINVSADQILFHMFNPYVKLKKCVLNAEEILCERTFIDSVRSIINTHSLVMHVQIKHLRPTNKLKRFVETVDLIEFESGSYKLRDQQQKERHQKLLITIDPMKALGFAGEIDKITIRPMAWMPGIVMTKIKPSKDYFEMADGWYISTT